MDKYIKISYISEDAELNRISNTDYESETYINSKYIYRIDNIVKLPGHKIKIFRIVTFGPDRLRYFWCKTNKSGEYRFINALLPNENKSNINKHLNKKIRING